MSSPNPPQKISYEIDKQNPHKGKFIIEAGYPGYGITWGNALRRVLLSSLEGGAPTAVKIKGARHEFSAMDGVKEDLLDVILNIKRLRVRVLSNEPVKLHLEAKGIKEVTADDFEPNAEVEITNKDLVIATLTEKKAEFEIDVWVSKGMGYAPSEEKDRQEFEVGAIILDSAYSPVISVNYTVEKMRVGKRVDFDKLIMDVETDGSITPMEAFKKSAQILAEHFTIFSEPEKVGKEESI
ncbi:MAG: DNA-directed RNA polymerase subunit alpha [Parcubacteria group bacterium]|nr:DNA-directed RNA polymerase subunit alpha [Parcubacteria group bacterium]